jgi:hypothetical protein
MYLFIYVYIYVYMCICMYVCMLNSKRTLSQMQETPEIRTYTYTCTYIYTHIQTCEQVILEQKCNSDPENARELVLTNGTRFEADLVYECRGTAPCSSLRMYICVYVCVCE